MRQSNGTLGPGITVIRSRNDRMKRELATKGFAFLVGAAVGAGALYYSIRTERKLLIDRIGAQNKTITGIAGKGKADTKMIADLTSERDRLKDDDHKHRLEIDRLRSRGRRAVAKRNGEETAVPQDASVKPAPAVGKSADAKSKRKEKKGFFSLFR